MPTFQQENKTKYHKKKKEKNLTEIYKYKD